MWFLLKILCFVWYIILPLFCSHYFSQEIIDLVSHLYPLGKEGQGKGGQAISIQRPYSMAPVAR